MYVISSFSNENESTTVGYGRVIDGLVLTAIFFTKRIINFLLNLKRFRALKLEDISHVYLHEFHVQFQIFGQYKRRIKLIDS